MATVQAKGGPSARRPAIRDFIFAVDVEAGGCQAGFGEVDSPILSNDKKSMAFSSLRQSGPPSIPPCVIPAFRDSRLVSIPPSVISAFRQSRLVSIPPCVIPAFLHFRLQSIPSSVNPAFRHSRESGNPLSPAI